MVSLAYALAIAACVAGASAHVVITRRRLRGDSRLSGLPIVLVALGAMSIAAWMVVLTQLN